MVAGTRAMVACAHPLAAMAGVQVLNSGGNAVDAAIAVSAALDVTEPFMSGLGGGGGMLIRPRGGPTHALHYGGTFPLTANVESLKPADIDRGPKACAVPGAPAGWFAALDRFGTRSFGDVVEPAIRYATDGFALTRTGAGFFKMGAGRLSQEGARVLGTTGGAPPVGTLIRQPALANTYDALATHGVEHFYHGDIGRSLTDALSAHGGIMSQEDLERPQVEWAEPSRGTYRGLDLVSTGWPFTSYEILLALHILERADVSSGLDDANTWHWLIEATKLAMADRVAFGGESLHLKDGLLSADYAQSRFDLLSAGSVIEAGSDRFTSNPSATAIAPGSPADFARECTTHFDVIDADG
ncbi:MAG: hypothetical protein HOI95_08570, partial [Chromatiales bacterium]|nr:hypothetical protein [Chromatiales bacterium]